MIFCISFLLVFYLRLANYCLFFRPPKLFDSDGFINEDVLNEPEGLLKLLNNRRKRITNIFGTTSDEINTKSNVSFSTGSLFSKIPIFLFFRMIRPWELLWLGNHQLHLLPSQQVRKKA